MTKNQIAFLELQETKRANQAREVETHRANVAQEQLTSLRDTGTLALRDRELAESVRSHYAQEGLQSKTIAETERSNRAREAENYRSNVARETEMFRSNVAREQENRRHNIASEGIGYMQASAAQTQAAAAMGNVYMRGEELASLNQYRGYDLGLRSAVQAETERSNLARERENAAHNRAMEKVARREATVKEGNLKESQRHNKQTELQGWVTTGSRVVDTLSGAKRNAVRNLDTLASLIIPLM